MNKAQKCLVVKISDPAENISFIHKKHIMYGSAIALLQTFQAKMPYLERLQVFECTVTGILGKIPYLERLQTLENFS